VLDFLSELGMIASPRSHGSRLCAAIEAFAPCGVSDVFLIVPRRARSDSVRRRPSRAGGAQSERDMRTL